MTELINSSSVLKESIIIIPLDTHPVLTYFPLDSSHTCQYPSLPTIGGLSAYIFALLACVFALVAAVLALDIASSDEDTISLNSVTI